ncbi:Tyrosine recombinase XerC [bioreactor metagenome]|uniref:Tyrosine recombinase XerC n=1 Tax=bioreactor metagenome TaxID=1076179 RepID=A0A644X4G0_9ZZZZ
MENLQGRTTIKRRKNLQLCKVEDISYQSLYDLYEKECKLKNLSDTTVKGYWFANKYFLEFAGAELKCCEVTQDLINSYILSLKERLKPQTVNSYVFKISPIVKYGISRGYIKDKIEFTHVIEQEHIKEIYTKEELEILLKQPNSDNFNEYRSWVIVNLLLATGMRALELREMQVKDVNLEQGIITLNHTKNRKARVIPIPTSLNLILDSYLRVRNATHEETVFCNIYGEPLNRTTLQCSIIKYCKRRGVEKHSLHLFRHTFITLSVQKGMSPLLLKRITGHSDFKMLNKYYQYNPVDLVNIVDEFNPLEQFKAKSKKY